MDKSIFLSNLKREYWENRLWLFITPVVLSVLLICLALVMAKHITALKITDQDISIFNNQTEHARVLDFSIGAEPLEGDDNPLVGAEQSLGDDAQLKSELNADIGDSPMGMEAVYLSSAWLVSFFYFASCLYSDRKDNSVLFWKSLPVSEREAVLSKLVFGAFGFTAVALVIAWLCYLVICLIALVTPIGELIFSDFTLADIVNGLFVAPVLVVLGFIRGLPIIGLLLLLSAGAKRSPLMMGAIALGAILLAERLLFSTSTVAQWLLWHLPLMSLETDISEGTSILGYHVMDLISHPFLLISGIVIGVAAILAAIWCREHHFEI